MISALASFRRVVLQIVGHPGCTPGPAREDAPVVAWVRGEEAGVAERPAPVQVSQGRVLGTVVGIEQHERVPARQHLRVLRGQRRGRWRLGCSTSSGSGHGSRGRPGRRRGHRPDEHEDILAASLIRALRQARQYHARRAASHPEDHGGERATPHGRNTPMSSASLENGAEREANQPVSRRAVQHDPEWISGPPRCRARAASGRRRSTRGCAASPAVGPLAPCRDGRAVVQHHDIGQRRARRQVVHIGQHAQRRRDARHRNLARLEAVGGSRVGAADWPTVDGPVNQTHAVVATSRSGVRMGVHCEPWSTW